MTTKLPSQQLMPLVMCVDGLICGLTGCERCHSLLSPGGGRVCEKKVVEAKRRSCTSAASEINLKGIWGSACGWGLGKGLN